MLLLGVLYFQAYKNYQAYRRSVEPPIRITPVEISQHESNQANYAGKYNHPKWWCLSETQNSMNLLSSQFVGYTRIKQSQ